MSPSNERVCPPRPPADYLSSHVPPTSFHHSSPSRIGGAFGQGFDQEGMHGTRNTQSHPVGARPTRMLWTPHPSGKFNKRREKIPSREEADSPEESPRRFQEAPDYPQPPLTDHEDPHIGMSFTASPSPSPPLMAGVYEIKNCAMGVSVDLDDREIRSVICRAPDMGKSQKVSLNFGGE